MTIGSAVRRLALGGGVCLLTSCAVFSPPDRHDAAQPLPETYSWTPTDDSPRPRLWWHAFNSDELNQLVRTALSDNFNLQAAWARLRQAEALAVQAGAARYPQLDLEAGGGYSRQRIDSALGTITVSGEDYRLGLAGGYELDLWGRVRAGQQAALSGAEAGREDLQTAATTLAARITDTWLGLISQQQQLQLLRKQLETNQTLLELVDLRFRRAMVSALDVHQQQQALSRVRAAIPLAEARQRILLHELGVLLGLPPSEGPAPETHAFPSIPPIPEPGLPLELLFSRPDLRAAELRLRQADWQVAAARKDRLPALRLTGRVGYGSENFSALLDHWLMSIALNLSAPLIDGKRRRAEVEQQQALAAERLASYRGVILEAAREVEDALWRERKQVEHLEALQEQVAAARAALEEARRRYIKGVTPFLTVLVELNALQRLEQEYIQQQQQRLLYRLALYRALGGHWLNDLDEETPIETERAP